MFELQNIRNDLAKKADQWKVDSLSSEVQSLKNQIRGLESKLDRMSQTTHQAQQAYSGLHELLEALSTEAGTDDDFINRMVEIKHGNQ